MRSRERSDGLALSAAVTLALGVKRLHGYLIWRSFKKSALVLGWFICCHLKTLKLETHPTFTDDIKHSTAILLCSIGVPACYSAQF